MLSHYCWFWFLVACQVIKYGNFEIYCNSKSGVVSPTGRELSPALINVQLSWQRDKEMISGTNESSVGLRTKGFTQGSKGSKEVLLFLWLTKRSLGRKKRSSFHCMIWQHSGTTANYFCYCMKVYCGKRIYLTQGITAYFYFLVLSPFHPQWPMENPIQSTWMQQIMTWWHTEVLSPVSSLSTQYIHLSHSFRQRMT